MPGSDFAARDTGTGSAASGGDVNARNIADGDVQTIVINPPPSDGDRQQWLVDTAYHMAQDVAYIRATMHGAQDDIRKLRKDVDHNNEALYGNGDGRVGLVERMRVAWRWLPVAIILAVISIILSSAILLSFVFAAPGV